VYKKSGSASLSISFEMIVCRTPEDDDAKEVYRRNL